MPPLELIDELRPVLGGALAGSPVVGLYLDSEGALIVWLNVSNVAMLYQLRDQLLHGHAAAQLESALNKRGKMAFMVKCDLSNFADRYEAIMLQLENLTPHQRAKLDKVLKRQHAGIDFPGRCVPTGTYFISSFPGAETELWKKMTTGANELSIACVFFPGGSEMEGVHSPVGDTPGVCECCELYKKHPGRALWDPPGMAPWGCGLRPCLPQTQKLVDRCAFAPARSRGQDTR